MPGPVAQQLARSDPPRTVVISCEHATSAIPKRYRAAFVGAEATLRTHRGSDLGAASLARELAKQLDAPPFMARASRLLVDANRSRHHRELFSKWSRRLDEVARRRILADYWCSHREAVESSVAGAVQRGHTVVHVSVHSFTPRLHGETRTADVALLYDPSRPIESDLAAVWLDRLGTLRPDLRLRRNYPYRGVADGLTRHLRQRFGTDYAGIELEVSQRFPLGNAGPWRKLRADIGSALSATLLE